MFYKKKTILKHFVIFTGKQLHWDLFFNVASHQACNFIKKKLQNRYFLVNIEKFIRTPILKNICKQLHFCKIFVRTFFRSELNKKLLKLFKTEQKFFLYKVLGEKKKIKFLRTSKATVIGKGFM